MAASLLGILAGTASALIGGGWQVATRQATSGHGLAVADVALVRYGLPALLLLPVLRGVWRRRALLDARFLALLAAGGGLPFGLLAIGGTQYAPAAHMGVLVAGASPVLAALFAWLLWGERPEGIRLAGLLLLSAGVFTLGAPALLQGGASWRGDLMFLGAAAAWAAFMLAFRRSGLGPWEATAWVNFASVLLLAPWWLLHGGATLAAATPVQLLSVVAWQGLLAGVVAYALFMQAIARLGPAPAAAFGALAPVFSAGLGWWWLGEALGPMELGAIAAAATGVVLASGAWAPRRRGAVAA